MDRSKMVVYDPDNTDHVLHLQAPSGWAPAVYATQEFQKRWPEAKRMQVQEVSEFPSEGKLACVSADSTYVVSFDGFPPPYDAS